MKVTNLQAGLQAATLVAAGLLISSLAGAALRPIHTTSPVPFCMRAAVNASPGTTQNLFGLDPRIQAATRLWRVDDNQDRGDGGGDRYQGNVGDRGNFGDRGNSGNYGDRGNYGNFGDRGIHGDRRNYGDRRDDSEDRDR